MVWLSVVRSAEYGVISDDMKQGSLSDRLERVSVLCRVVLCVCVLQGVLSEEFKANEIEVGVVRAGFNDNAFHVLSADEVEVFLTAISERD